MAFRFLPFQWLGDNCQILAVRSDICKIGQLSDRTTVSADNCQIGQLSVQTTVSGDNCQWGQLSVRTTVSGTTVSGPWTTVRGNCQCSEKTVRSYSCPHWVQLLFISGSSSPGVVFFSYWILARGQRLVEWVNCKILQLSALKL